MGMTQGLVEAVFASHLCQHKPYLSERVPCNVLSSSKHIGNTSLGFILAAIILPKRLLLVKFNVCIAAWGAAGAINRRLTLSLVTCVYKEKNHKLQLSKAPAHLGALHRCLSQARRHDRISSIRAHKDDCSPSHPRCYRTYLRKSRACWPQ
jgi:hypothetical protein